MKRGVRRGVRRGARRGAKIQRKMFLFLRGRLHGSSLIKDSRVDHVSWLYMYTY